MLEMKQRAGMLLLGTTIAGFAAVTVTSACNSDDSAAAPPGPDGGSDGEPNSTRVRIVSQTPPHQNEETSVHSPIQAKFSAPIKLGASPVTLFAGNVSIAVTTTLSADGTTLDVVPSSAITAPAEMTLRFGDVTDAQGKPLDLVPWTWTVPSWIFVRVSKKPTSEASFRVATGPGDAVYLSEFQGGIDQGTLTLLTSERSGISFIRFAPDLNYASGGPLPDLHIDKDGAPVVVSLDPAHKLSAKRWSGSAWNDLAMPDDSGAEQYRAAFIAPAKTGKLVVAYEVKFAGKPESEIHVQQLADGVWSPLGGVVAPAGAVLQSVALDNNGLPSIASLDESSGDGRVRTWSGTSWTDVGSAVNGADTRTAKMSIAWDDGGNLFNLVSLNPRDGSAYRNRLLRLDPTGAATWAAVGDALPNGQMKDPVSLLPEGAGLLFASFATVSDGHLWTLEATKTGWTAIPSPDKASQVLVPYGAGVDGHGVPVVGWSPDDLNIIVKRPNR